MRHVPIVFEWREIEVADAKTGEVSKTRAMVPIDRLRGIASRQFEPDKEYRAGEWIIGGDVRSAAQHKRYFAALRQSFDNLPDTVTNKRTWPTVEHFRAWLLIELKWCNEKEIDCADEKSARRLAMHVRTESPYARIKIEPDLITGKLTRVFIWVAMSQDYGSMDKDTFKQSSDQVLECAAHFIQVTRGNLLKEAGRNA